VKPLCATMDEHRFVDYFVVTGLPSPVEWKTRQSYVIGQHDPVIDVVVINRTSGEKPPAGYICIESTPTGLSANLNHGSLRAPEMFMCYQRGRDKTPIVDIRFDYFITFYLIMEGSLTVGLHCLSVSQSVCLCVCHAETGSKATSVKAQ